MAATVLSGTGNVSYTNNTGQNVRIIINYLINYGNATGTITVSNSDGTGIDILLRADTVIGKNLAYSNHNGNVHSQNSNTSDTSYDTSDENPGIPLEVAVEPGGTFSVTTSNNATRHNILIIPEAG